MDIKQEFRYFDSNTDKLTPGQVSFINSLKRYFRRNKELTYKQQLIMSEIKKTLVAVAVTTVKKRVQEAIESTQDLTKSPINEQMR